MRDTTTFVHMREVVMAAVNDLAREHPEIVMLDADLSTCFGTNSFCHLYPKRFFNCGIAEANMIGVAAGLASMGLVPYAQTFGCFASRRAHDQFFLSVGYTGQVVHVIGSDPGITAQHNGGTHMPFEDIALIRQIPGVTIIEPSDAHSCYELMRQAYDMQKSSYTRVPRKGITHRYPAGTPIELGKGIELSKGEDVAIIATGEVLVNAAEKGVELLAKKGINATLVDLHTIRPLDYDLITEVAKRCKRVLVCENGRYAGGIGEAIAGYLVTTNPVSMDFISVGEAYGEVGQLDYLAKLFGFTAENIAKRAEALTLR